MFPYFITFISYVLKPEKRKLIKFSYELRRKTGLEIGGPSSIFGSKGSFPVYLFAKQVDGVNFSNETVWEGKISKGKNYSYFKNKKGFQYIEEASELGSISGKSYDFLLSSHSLEHIANPIKALKRWHTLLKSHGYLILILPDKNNTFDSERPYTSFEHLLKDYEHDTNEHDTTHFAEIMRYYKSEGNEGDTAKEAVKTTLENNFVVRCAHHHVFSFETIREVLQFCGFTVLYQQSTPPFHLITIAKKN